MRTVFSLYCTSMATTPGNHTCILHSKTVAIGPDNLISPQSYEYWLTLFEAAKICKFTPALCVAQNLEEHEAPSIFYHSKCQSIFTMNRDLETITRKNQNPHDKEDEDFKPATKKRNVTTPRRV